MRIFKHGLVAGLACALLQLGFVAAATPARAAQPTRCESHVPAALADFQAVANGRNASFGIGDITSAIRLPDGRLFFTLGDTGYYNLQANGSAGPMQGFGNNSAWVLSGKCFTLLNRPGPGARSWLLPPENDGSVYWPGASVVVGPRLYVFLTRLFDNTTFGRPVGAAVAVFDLPSLQLARITEIPFATNRIFGLGAVYDGGYLYTYASQQETCRFCFAGDMYIARVPETAIQTPSAWRFLAGSAWVSNIHAATPALRAAVSNVNIQPYGNGYLLLTKTLNILGPNVERWWSPSPTGPWRDLGLALSVPDPPPSYVPGFRYAAAFTYNPVVLPSVRLADGGFLGSYNVNTFNPSDARIDGRMTGPRFVSIPLPPAPAAPPRPRVTPAPSPWTPTYGVDRAGRVRTVNGGVGLARSYTSHAVGIARTPTGRGAWVTAADGGVFSIGDARFFGSMGGKRLNQPIVGIGATPTGNGYWLVARDGGIFSFGDARFFGSTGNLRLQKPVLSMATTPSGRGYRLAASDGGIFSFGDAPFYGSTGGRPPVWPVTGMATAPDGRGYWLVTLIGQVFGFGSARNAGGINPPVRAACIGIVAAPGGYRLVDIRGNVFLRGARTGLLRIPTPSFLIAAG